MLCAPLAFSIKGHLPLLGKGETMAIGEIGEGNWHSEAEWSEKGPTRGPNANLCSNIQLLGYSYLITVVPPSIQSRQQSIPQCVRQLQV